LPALQKLLQRRCNLVHAVRPDVGEDDFADQACGIAGSFQFLEATADPRPLR
jgi:hypothetical protein